MRPIGTPLRAVLVMPDAAAYGPATLGSLPLDDPLVERADELRRGRGLESLRAIDRAPRYDPAVHGRPANGGPLSYLVALLDAERALLDHEVVAVVATSVGWCAALAATGAISAPDGLALIQEIGLLQEAVPDSARIVYPVTDGDWRPMDACRRALDAALSDSDGNGGGVALSIEMGGYAVLAGGDAAVTQVAGTLPAVQIGERSYPLRLAGLGGLHTPAAQPLADQLASRMAEIVWRVPQTTLIDGRGMRYAPWSTDPAELARYSLGELLVTPYRFATGLRVALREYAPDVLVLPGPGSSLGAICGQVIAAEGYRTVRSRRDFRAVQASPQPLVLAMRR